MSLTQISPGPHYSPVTNLLWKSLVSRPAYQSRQPFIVLAFKLFHSFPAEEKVFRDRVARSNELCSFPNSSRTLILKEVSTT